MRVYTVFARCLAFLVLWSTVEGQTVSTLSGPLNASGGIRVDKSGNIYVADFGQRLDNANGTTVYKISPDGQVRVFAMGLSGASGNYFDAEGNLFQSNIASGIISKISPDGTVSTFSSGHRAPVGIAIDNDGFVYVANCGNNTIRRIDPEGGESSFFASSPLFNCPNSLTIDDEGNLYTVCFGNSNMVKISPDGQASFFASIPGGNCGHLTFANNRFYVVARGAHQIYEVSKSGEVRLLAGSGLRGKDDGPAALARFSLPNGIDASPGGDTLYTNDVVSNVGTDLNPIVIRRIILGAATDVYAESGRAARQAQLETVSPNPFSMVCSVGFHLPRAQSVTIALYDVLGQKAHTLIEGRMSAGDHNVTIPGTAIRPGVYFLRLNAGGSALVRQVVRRTVSP